MPKAEKSSLETHLLLKSDAFLAHDSKPQDRL